MMHRIIHIVTLAMVVGVFAFNASTTQAQSTWSCTFDFSVSDGGFIPVATNGGVWQGGTGWVAQNYTGSLWRVVIDKTFADTNITSVELNASIPGNQTYGNIIRLRDNGTQVYVSQANFSGGVRSVTMNATADEIELFYPDSNASYTYESVVIGGTGIAPFSGAGITCTSSSAYTVPISSADVVSKSVNTASIQYSTATGANVHAAFDGSVTSVTDNGDGTSDVMITATSDSTRIVYEIVSSVSAGDSTSAGCVLGTVRTDTNTLTVSSPDKDKVTLDADFTIQPSTSASCSTPPSEVCVNNDPEMADESQWSYDGTSSLGGIPLPAGGNPVEWWLDEQFNISQVIMRGYALVFSDTQLNLDMNRTPYVTLRAQHNHVGTNSISVRVGTSSYEIDLPSTAYGFQTYTVDVSDALANASGFYDFGIITPVLSGQITVDYFCLYWTTEQDGTTPVDPPPTTPPPTPPDKPANPPPTNTGDLSVDFGLWITWLATELIDFFQYDFTQFLTGLISQIITTIQNCCTMLGWFMRWVMGTTNMFWEWFNYYFIGWLEGWFSIIASGTVVTVTQTTPTGGAACNNVFCLFTVFFEQIGGTLQSLFDNLAEVVGSLAELGGIFATEIGKVTSTLINTTGDVIISLGNDLRILGQTLINGLVTLSTRLMDMLAPILYAIFDILVQILNGVVTVLLQLIEAFLAVAILFLLKILEIIVTIFTVFMGIVGMLISAPVAVPAGWPDCRVDQCHGVCIVWRILNNTIFSAWGQTFIYLFIGYMALQLGFWSVDVLRKAVYKAGVAT